MLDRANDYIGVATNNTAEYRALLLGLERARELGAREVEVVNDSQLVARQVTGEYRVKKDDLRPLHAQALAALRGFDRWSIRSVPREQNEHRRRAGQRRDRRTGRNCVGLRFASPKLSPADTGRRLGFQHGKQRSDRDRRTVHRPPPRHRAAALPQAAGAPAWRCAAAGRHARRRILVVETLLCTTLWGPQPAGWLWIGSRVFHETDSIGLAILVAFAGMLTRSSARSRSRCGSTARGRSCAGRAATSRRTACWSGSS